VYGYGVGPPRSSGSGFWTGLEPNRTVFPVQTRNAGGLLGPIANTTQSQLPSVSPDSLDYGLQVHSIMASNCISPNSLDCSFHKFISKLAQSRSRSTSLSSLDHGLHVYRQIRSITASKCISNVAQSQPWSISLSSLDHHFQAHLEFHSSTACCQSRYSVRRWVAI
jgi:hypothetical protein